MSQSFTTLSALRREQLKISIPSKDDFQVFIRPENIADKIELTPNRATITYIPNINSDSNNIFLMHNTQYSIGILNYSRQDCNADIFIDGFHCGTFRVLKNTSNFRLQRPVDANKSFNFISQNSEQAIIAGHINDNSPNLGEILVEIRPKDTSYSRESSTTYGIASAGIKVETDSSPPKPNDATDGVKSTDDIVNPNGLTVLGSSTGQRFKEAPFIHTRGLHKFLYKLVIGDPDNNTIFFINN